MSNDRVLVVDDDGDIRNIIGIYLKNNGYQVDFAENGQVALDLISEDHDLVLLDIMMPVMDGLETIKKIREKHATPVIFLTAKSSDYDKIEGIMTGADDYIVKPFNPTELIVRIRANIRRYKVLGGKKAEQVEEEKESHKIVIEDIVIDSNEHVVLRNDKVIKLTKTEFEILHLLASNRGRVFNSEFIVGHIFDDPSIVIGSNSIAVHIRNLRNKIEHDSKNPTIIKNIWGVGYKIEK